MQRLLLLGLNHTTAPLEVRERLAFDAQQYRRAISSLREKFPESETVIVSTCNRVEMYVARALHGHPRSEEMTEFLGDFHGVAYDDFRPHLYELSERDVVKHLFSVTASLDSMVLGENQILGQVRDAYDVAREMNATGPWLNPLFQRAIAAGKEVMHTTSLGGGSVSIAGVAVGYAKRIFDHFDDKTVLCVGAGKMAAIALRGFAALKPKQLIVCSRDIEKAKEVAREFNGIGAGFDTLDEQLALADIVITSTGASHPIITRSRFESVLKQRRYRPIFIIDIAVPRDVEASVGELEHVYLYNLDDLQQAIVGTHSQRNQSLDAARAIVAKHVDEFVLWHRKREMGPLIDQLYQRLHKMAAEEAGRTINQLPNLGEDEKSHLRDLARRIVNKLLHDPVNTLRDNDKMHAPTAQYLHAIERMFKLNEENHPTQRDSDAG
jgi:glutamyl-tRNA reductase